MLDERLARHFESQLGRCDFAGFDMGPTLLAGYSLRHLVKYSETSHVLYHIASRSLMKQQLYSLGRIGFLLAIIVAVPQLHADEPKWEAAKIKNSPLSFGKLTDTGSITVEGKFTDAAATYNVLEEKDKFVKLSDGKQSGWVFKVSINRTESVVAPPELATKQSTDAPRDPLLGTEVFLKDSAIANVGNEVVDKYKVLSWPATVEDVNGGWLWLGRAWVRRTDVMNLEQAFDYYVEEVRNNPKSARAWWSRAGCWSVKGELNNALRAMTKPFGSIRKFLFTLPVAEMRSVK